MLSRPVVLLRVEGGCLLVAAVVVYAHFQFSWLLFALLFLAPDLFMLGYSVNARVGSVVYNLGHVVVAPLALFALGYGLAQHWLVAISIIWFSHIAFDRLLGYGLKYPTYFKDTHLQHVV